MTIFKSLEGENKSKVNFIHFNHTNPVLDPESEAFQTVIQNGFRIADEDQFFVF